jgi:hypothetical protein
MYCDVFVSDWRGAMKEEKRVPIIKNARAILVLTPPMHILNRIQV